MKAVIGLATAATLAVGLVGVAPASADHIPSWLSDDAATCTLDLLRAEGISGRTDQVLHYERAEVRPGDDAPGAFDSYTCRFDGLTYVDPDTGGDPVPYVPPGEVTWGLSCGTGYDPEFVGGQLTIFEDGSALLECGEPEPDPDPDPEPEPDPEPARTPTPTPTSPPVPAPAPPAPPAPAPAQPAPLAPPVPDQPGTKRLAGQDRYSTAAQIVRDSFPSGPVPVVFIATGEAFADALAGGPAADVLGGPVLPVAAAGIPAPVLAELDRLQPARIVILGGRSAVSDAISDQLQLYTDGTVTRLAGVNRYATAANVATSVFTAPVPQVLIATGQGFADALAGGALGALTDSPVLLAAPNSLPPETAAALRALQPRDIAVLGGTSAVSDAVLEQLRSYTNGGVNRLSGADRYATAARLAQVFWPGTADVVYLATGRNFPDALAGVPAAALDGAPLMLVEPNCMPAATRRELDRLQPTTLVVLGGTSTVGNAAATGTTCAAPASPTAPANPAPPPPPAPAPDPDPAPAPAPAPAPVPAPDPGVYYENCAAARAAGAAPLYVGEPGYRSGLDRDDDGVACE